MGGDVKSGPKNAEYLKPRRLQALHPEDRDAKTMVADTLEESVQNQIVNARIHTS